MTESEVVGLFERTKASVRRIGLSILRSPEDAADLTQEVSLIALSERGTLQAESAEGWVMTAAKNKAIDMLRKQKPVLMDELPEKAAEETPMSLLLKAEQKEHLQIALNLLPPKDRDIIIRRDLEEASYKNLAAEYGLSEDAVRQRYSRALKKLKKIIVSDEMLASVLCPEGYKVDDMNRQHNGRKTERITQ